MCDLEHYEYALVIEHQCTNGHCMAPCMSLDPFPFDFADPENLWPTGVLSLKQPFTLSAFRLLPPSDSTHPASKI